METKKDKKAESFYEIMNVTQYNQPVTTDSAFFVDFSGFRKDFSENKIYKQLGIQPNTGNCNKLHSTIRIFISGHRGTGKTSELLKLTKQINETKCFLTIFADLSDGSLDTSNLDFVDIALFMLEKLLQELEEKKIKISKKIIEPMYNFYSTRIKEIENKENVSIGAEIKTSSKVGLFDFFTLASSIRAKTSNASQTRELIRQEFKNTFVQFAQKFDEFSIQVKEKLQKQGIENILFILDGFEKIFTKENRRKILIDDSNKFIELKSNLILTPPIELYYDIAKDANFPTPFFFPLIVLEEKSKELFTEFIYKRVDKKLFSSSEVVDKIIHLGGGSPRETLRIIQDSYINSETELIDKESVATTKRLLSAQIVNSLTEEEIAILKQIERENSCPFNEAFSNVLEKRAILDYGNGVGIQINPLILDNEKLIHFLK